MAKSLRKYSLGDIDITNFSIYNWSSVWRCRDGRLYLSTLQIHQESLGVTTNDNTSLYICDNGRRTGSKTRKQPHQFSPNGSISSPLSLVCLKHLDFTQLPDLRKLGSVSTSHCEQSNPLGPRVARSTAPHSTESASEHHKAMTPSKVSGNY